MIRSSKRIRDRKGVSGRRICVAPPTRRDSIRRRVAGATQKRPCYTRPLMCGLTGFITASPSRDLLPDVRRMSDALLHRGPDDGGEWTDPQLGVALGFRRLSIIDLSPAGHQ